MKRLLALAALSLLILSLFLCCFAAFPRPYRGIVEHSGLSPALAYAVMKAESNFEESAVSSAGAVGLMQLLPSTAQFIAERSGIPFPETAVWKRAAVMAAGPFMNFVLGFAVLLGLIALRPDPIASKIIYEIEPGALCGQTGLAAGDEIIAVNGRRCFVANDIIYELVRTRDAEADFTVRRAGQVIELPGVRFDTYTDADGNARMNMGFTVYALEKTPANILRETVNSELYYGRVIYTSLLDLVRGRESVNNLSGPVGIVSAISQAASYGLEDLLSLLVLITVNLGIFNLLPIPALDGGRLVFLAAEAVLRRPVSERLQETLTLATFLLLFGLMIFATYNDVIRLFTGGF